jgi:hypothetical protein
VKLGDSPLLKKSGLKDDNSPLRFKKPSMVGSLPPQIKTGGILGNQNINQKPLTKGTFNWDDTTEEKLTEGRKFLAGNSGLRYSGMTNVQDDDEEAEI